MLAYIVGSVLTGALGAFAYIARQDYKRWKNPRSYPSRYGDVDPKQLQRIEQNQRQIASMDRGAVRS